MAEKKEKPSQLKKSIESQYLEIVVKPFTTHGTDDYSLEQPHARKIVNSVTTYGAYEKPI